MDDGQEECDVYCATSQWSLGMPKSREMVKWHIAEDCISGMSYSVYHSVRNNDAHTHSGQMAGAGCCRLIHVFLQVRGSDQIQNALRTAVQWSKVAFPGLTGLFDRSLSVRRVGLALIATQQTGGDIKYEITGTHLGKLSWLMSENGRPQ